MRATAAAPAVLGRDHPEWKPWLALLVEMQRALGQPPWARLVSPEPDAAASDAPSSVPRLDGAVVAVDPPAVRQFVRDLFTIAGLSASWPGVAADGRESLGLLEAAVCQDTGRLEEWAHRLNVLFPALSAVATVAAMPLLHACRQASKEPPGWTEGYCPVCGAWPVLAEARGLERSRQLRCARCGCDWRSDWLRCPFCRNGDHTRLGSLVGESTLETFRIETCAVCRGCLKTLTTLRPTPADAVVLVDLGSVDLDVAALEHGYGPPGEPGYPVRARLVPGGVMNARPAVICRGLLPRWRPRKEDASAANATPRPTPSGWPSSASCSSGPWPPTRPRRPSTPGCSSSAWPVLRRPRPGRARYGPWPGRSSTNIG